MLADLEFTTKKKKRINAESMFFFWAYRAAVGSTMVSEVEAV